MNGYGHKTHHTAPAALLTAALFFFGCASGKNDRPFLEKKAAGLEAAGIDAWGSGDLDRAFNKFSEALAANRSVDNRAGELSDLINIGRVMILMGDYGSSVSYLNSATALAERLKDEASLSEAKATLAKARFSSGDNAAALAEIDAGLAIDKRLGREGGAKLNLKASILMDEGRTDEARDILKKALKESESAGDLAEAANALRLMAETESGGGAAPAALKLYERAYAYDKKLGDPVKIALDLKNMAALNLREGRALDAAFLFERHYAVARTIGRIEEAVESIEELIKIYAAAGDAKKTGEYTKLRDSLLQAADADKGSGIGK